MTTRGHKGKYQLQFPEKYVGDKGNVVFRSTWELLAFRWIDSNPDVSRWSSEGVVIEYICATDKQPHRYFVDLWIQFRSGRRFLIEIKPKHQTVPPKKTRGKKRELFESEVLTFVKNQSKWHAADAYAKKRGMEFYVWTEDSLAKLGIKLNINRPRKPKTP